MAHVTLSAEQFRRLCSALQVPEPSSDERRRSARVEFRAPISVALTDGVKIMPAVTSTLRDFSDKGATLSHPTPLKPESRLVWSLGGEATTIRIVATVVHCKCFADGSSLIGIAFQGFVDAEVKKAKAVA